MPSFSVSTLERIILYQSKTGNNFVTRKQTSAFRQGKKEQHLDHSFLVSPRACLLYAVPSSCYFVTVCMSYINLPNHKGKRDRVMFWRFWYTQLPVSPEKYPWCYFSHAYIYCFIDCKWLWIWTLRCVTRVFFSYIKHEIVKLWGLYSRLQPAEVIDSCIYFFQISNLFFMLLVTLGWHVSQDAATCWSDA